MNSSHQTRTSTIANPKAILFIDPAVQDYESLMEGVVAGTEVILLNPHQDGVEQITAALGERQGIDSIHILSHGNRGEIQLGAGWLKVENLEGYAEQIGRWGRSLNPEASLHLYGCNVATDTTGMIFVQNLAQLAQTNVAASIDLTGNLTLGGDWDLEYQTGSVNETPIFEAATLTSYAHVLVGISINDFTILTEGNSGTKNAVFTVSLDAVATETVTVEYDILDRSATIADNDYTVASPTGTLTFAPGQLTQQITVQINGDTTVESNESFLVRLKNPSLGNTIAPDKDFSFGIISNDDTVLSINDVNLAEGNSGTQTLTFTVTRTGDTSGASSVSYATRNGTATAGSDYATTDGTLNFATGETSKTISVTVNGDTDVESNEQFFVDLSNASGAVIGTATGQGTILDDDATPGLPTLAINSVTIAEGDTGTTSLVFTVTRSGDTTQTSSVTYTTSNDTADAADFAAATGTVEFLAGETTKTIAIAITGDTTIEPDEQFFVDLSGAVDATITTARGIGTITSDDIAPGLPTLTIDSVSIAEGDTGTTSLVFTVTRSGDTTQASSVAYATSNDTADAADFAAATGTVEFLAGETTKTIAIAINGDTTIEPDEQFFVDLSTPVGATITTARGIGTITNNDNAPALPTLAIDSVTITEGDINTANLVFTVTRSGNTTQASSVAYTTSNDTAIAPTDYTPLSGTLDFLAGEVTKTITIVINGDTTIESDEQFFVDLSGAVGATITTARGIGTITNDDAAALPAISIANASVLEGNSGTTTLTFTLTRTGNLTASSTVSYATANGTATAGEDYIAVPTGTVTFAAGEASKTIAITVNGDTVNEPDENFSLTLSNPIDATLTTASAIGTIQTDDSGPLVSFAPGNVSQLEGNSGTTAFDFVVQLTAASSQPVTVTYVTSDGTTTPNDYTDNDGSITFAPGETSKTITVLVNGDTTAESDENFTVTLTGVTTNNATLDTTAAQRTGTIQNDDTAGVPTVSIATATLAQPEGDSGTNTYTFNVSLSSPATQAISVNYTTSDGTANASEDYVDNDGVLSFAIGEQTKTITVTVNGDTKPEADETFVVTLIGATGASVNSAQSQSVGTITNDDAGAVLPRVAIQPATLTKLEGNSGTTAYEFVVTLNQTPTQLVTIDYNTNDGTAIAGQDYTDNDGTLTFNAGQQNQIITVLVNGDTTPEPNKDFTVVLSNPVGLELDTSASQSTATITDDDTVPVISVENAAVSEGNDPITLMNFTVTLSTASTQVVRVAYATADGSATLADRDYNAATGTLTFLPGETSKTIPVQIRGNLNAEGAETFTLNFSNPENATLARTEAIGTIINDDTPPTISVRDVALNEGNSGKPTRHRAICHHRRHRHRR